MRRVESGHLTIGKMMRFKLDHGMKDQDGLNKTGSCGFMEELIMKGGRYASERNDWRQTPRSMNAPHGVVFSAIPMCQAFQTKKGGGMMPRRPGEGGAWGGQ